MTTWLQDLERTDPKLAAAWRIVGNQDRVSIRNMIRALELFPGMNSEEDRKRLAAAKYIRARGFRQG